ncbi:BnaA09g08840D [Brassica napus]|uniref:BnaA09g08840D protein n=1 Tax=Brassica napus TaxID=3708 RepID=A0A078I961_BRANA|nr:BnaA09g08840D [Brassica napus]
MDKESATPSGAASNAIKATAHLKEVVNREPRDDLEKHKKDITEKKAPDVIEMLKGLVDLLEKMEEKVDHRLREIEEKVDMLISSVSLNNNEVAASMKTGSVKAAEADNMSVDESSSDDDDEEESVQRNYRANTKKATTTSFGPFGPFVRGRGYGPTSLNVGGPFSGGRCGGRGECSFC